MESEKMYTKNEVAEFLRVTLTSIDNWMKSGKIKYYKIGNSVRISETQLKEYLEKSKV